MQFGSLDDYSNQYFLGMFTIFGDNLREMLLNFTDFCFKALRACFAFFLVFLHYDWFHQFFLLIDIIVFDQPGKIYRFSLIYYIISLIYNSRYQLLIQTDSIKSIESIYMIYKSANWSEREVWDMFGVFILFHPDLRRILTDYGFRWFPLRKDFPLSGIEEMNYSDFIKNTKYFRVELTQEFRNTDYNKRWYSFFPK